MIQVLVGATQWRFKSSHPHQIDYKVLNSKLATGNGGLIFGHCNGFCNDHARKPLQHNHRIKRPLGAVLWWPVPLFFSYLRVTQVSCRAVV